MTPLPETHPVFICGDIRTGTTLMLALLDGHPSVCSFPTESHFFTHFLPRARGLDRAGKIALAKRTFMACFDEEHHYYQRFLTHISSEAVFEAFQEKLATHGDDDRDYLMAATVAYGLACGTWTGETTMWAEKTPGTECFADRIFDRWPEAKCIHIVRDPRDQYTSIKLRDQQRRGRSSSLGAMVYRWKAGISLLRRHRDRYGETRYMSLTYEDLVGNTDAVLAEVTAFLGIEDLPLLRQPTKGGGHCDWKGNAIDQKFTGISTSSLGRWREHLDAKEAAIIETLLGKEMASFGYEPEHAGRIRTWPQSWTLAGNVWLRRMRRGLGLGRSGGY